MNTTSNWINEEKQIPILIEKFCNFIMKVIEPLISYLLQDK